MLHRANPFLERMAERTTSDQEFVRLFSPKILERLPAAAFDGAVHVFRSPPGGGKTTILRAFTPSALKAFWNARKSQHLTESFQGLAARKVLAEVEGPLLLGVLLSCASGYADLPAVASFAPEGLFRALLDCRIVLRTLRNLATFVGLSSIDQIDDVRPEYDDSLRDLQSIPRSKTLSKLVEWAEQRERSVYAQLDAIEGTSIDDMPAHVRFEGVLWLQGITFIYRDKIVAPQRLLMIDDLHKLRRKQRDLLVQELIEIRPNIPIWLAERNIALGQELLSQGARVHRDVNEYDLEEFWNSGTNKGQFTTYAQNILDRRLDTQNIIPTGSFTQYLRTEYNLDELRNEIEKGVGKFISSTQRLKTNSLYTKWLEHTESLTTQTNLDGLKELYTTLILIARNEGKRQLSFELTALSTDELDDRDSSQVKGAAEIFMQEDLKIPYYYGIDRLCAMATNNIEELLSIAAV